MPSKGIVIAKSWTEEERARLGSVEVPLYKAGWWKRVIQALLFVVGFTEGQEPHVNNNNRRLQSRNHAVGTRICVWCWKIHRFETYLNRK